MPSFDHKRKICDFLGVTNNHGFVVLLVETSHNSGHHSDSQKEFHRNSGQSIKFTGLCKDFAAETALLKYDDKTLPFIKF